MSGSDDGTTVTVTRKGQATIPKEFRDKLHINTPGRVRFVENEQGEVVVRPVKRPAKLRGALAADGPPAPKRVETAPSSGDARLPEGRSPSPFTPRRMS